MTLHETNGLQAFALWIEQRNARDLAALDPILEPRHINDPRLSGDPWRLRGIPVVGVVGGVGGASPGSRPGSAIR